MSAQLALDLHAPTAGRFYVTTRLTPSELDQAIADATAQEVVVLALYRVHAVLRPSECHRYYIAKTGKANTPATSIRRAITSLTKDGALQKMELQAKGPMGKSEHYWRLCA